MPLFIRIVAAGLEDGGEPPYIAQQLTVMMAPPAMPPAPPADPPPPIVSPFLTPTLTLS